MVDAITTVVINLDGDTDRLAHMRAQARRAGLQFERFPAIRGDALTPELAPYFPDQGSHPILSRGEIGCYASHLAVCRRIARGGLRAPVLVLEDDVAFAEDFATVLQAALRAAPSGWDVVRLSSETKYSCLSIASLGDDKSLIRYSNVPSGAGAILWSRSGAEKFVRRWPRTLPVDQDLRFVWKWGLNTFGVTPAPAIRDQCGASRIDGMAPDGWRSDSRRNQLLRGARRRDVLQRHAHGLKLFGAADWLRAEILNLIARRSRVLEPLGGVRRGQA